MQKLYQVSININTDLTVMVAADDKSEAEMIAHESYTLSDLYMDTWTDAEELTKCPDWAANKVPEGSDGKTCSEIMDGENYKEEREFRLAESWPKLPGFSETVQVT